MLRRDLQAYVRFMLPVVIATLLFAVCIGFFVQTTSSHDTMLPGCALMMHTQGHDGNLCPMDSFTHFANLQSMFIITIAMISTLALVLLIQSSLFTRLYFFVRYVYAPPDTFFIRSRTEAVLLGRNLRLQEAFSRGILHSKTYEQ